MYKYSLSIVSRSEKNQLVLESLNTQRECLYSFTMQSYKSYYMVSLQTVFTYPFHELQSYKSYYMVSRQTVFTYPLHHAKLQVLLHGVTANSLYLLYPFQHAKLQVLLHGVTANSLYLSFSPCKATSLTSWCHRKQSLLILFTMQSYKSYFMVSPQTVFTYPFHHAKLQILLHGVTANSLYLSFSPCKATSLTSWCHRKQSLHYPFHHAKLQILLHGVTANSLYLSFSPCKATSLTSWCHRKQSLLILFTMQSYKSYYMVSPQTVFTYPFHHAKLQILLHGVTATSLYLSFSPCKLQVLLHGVTANSLYLSFHHAKLQILLHGVTANSLYLSFSPCKATSLTTWCHRKQSLLILFTMQSYKSYYMVSPQTVFTYPFHHAKLQVLLHVHVSPQTVFTYPFHHAKLQILLTAFKFKLCKDHSHEFPYLLFIYFMHFLFCCLNCRARQSRKHVLRIDLLTGHVISSPSDFFIFLITSYWSLFLINKCFR